MFSRFIHVTTGVRASFLLCGRITFHWVAGSRFIHSSADETLALFLPYGYCVYCCCEYLCTSFCLNIDFHCSQVYIPRPRIAGSSVILWKIDGETMETVTDFIFLGSKITADGDCSHEIKRRLLLGGKAMTNLDWVLKGRDITWPTKICIVKAMVFPVVMYECEHWTIKSTEELTILNCGAGEDSWESLGLQGEPTSQS